MIQMKELTLETKIAFKEIIENEIDRYNFYKVMYHCPFIINVSGAYVYRIMKGFELKNLPQLLEFYRERIDSFKPSNKTENHRHKKAYDSLLEFYRGLKDDFFI